MKGTIFFLWNEIAYLSVWVTFQVLCLLQHIGLMLHASNLLSVLLVWLLFLFVILRMDHKKKKLHYGRRGV